MLRLRSSGVARLAALACASLGGIAAAVLLVRRKKHDDIGSLVVRPAAEFEVKEIVPIECTTQEAALVDCAALEEKTPIDRTIQEAALVDCAAQEDWARELVSAAWDGHTDVVKEMLQGPRPTGPTARALDVLINHRENYPSICAAGAASVQGQAAVLQLLLEARADANLHCQRATQGSVGGLGGSYTLTERDTALCFAVREGHRPCVEALLAAGADPNIRCDSEYLLGLQEWGEDDDGTDTMIYAAVDVAHMARRPDLAELIEQHGGVRLAGKPMKCP